MAVIVQCRLRIRFQFVAITARANFIRKQRIGNAHLVQVSVAGELLEAWHLRLPAKFSDRCTAVNEIGHDAHPTCRSIASGALFGRQRVEVRIRYSINETEAEERSGAAGSD